GGFGNTNLGVLSFIGGGYYNLADGNGAVVAGGESNRAAGSYSMAAGYHAKALHNGSFVWGDTAGGDFSSTGINQFLIRAVGGIGININNPQAPLDVAGTIRMTGFQLPVGASAGQVLTSDATGN